MMCYIATIPFGGCYSDETKLIESIDIEKNPKVLYGFWQLMDYINKNCLIQA